MTSSENSCNSGVQAGDPRAAAFIGFLTIMVMLLSGYFAWRPPRSILRLVGATAALAIVSYVANAFGVVSHIDWCAFRG
jgi:hypothetical protein